MERFRKTTKRSGMRSMWVCKCDCGNEVTLRKDAFMYKSSTTKSCGCWFLETNRNKCLKRNAENNPAKKGDEHYMRVTGIRYPQCSKTGRFIKHK